MWDPKFPDQGLNLRPLQRKHGVLSPGSPGKSPLLLTLASGMGFSMLCSQQNQLLPAELCSPSFLKRTSSPGEASIPPQGVWAEHRGLLFPERPAGGVTEKALRLTVPHLEP